MAKKIVTEAVKRVPEKADWPCHSALSHAFLTDRKLWPAKTVKELEPLLARYL
jgi:hypothetical protein